MKRPKTLIRILVLIILVTAGCQSRIPDNDSLTIAVAANMQFTMKLLMDEFTAEYGIPCHLVVSSSGKLTAQIKEGAPYDIFVSADLKYPEELYDAGLAVNPPETYALGKLVLWTMYDSIPPTISSLLSPGVKHIATSNPKTAPYGVAAMQVMERENILGKVKDKLVYGESVAQTNQFIVTKSAEIGFTALSVVLSNTMKGKGTWQQVDSSLYDPIEQGVVLIRNNNRVKPQARKFYNYLFSIKSKKILKKFGYSINE